MEFLSPILVSRAAFCRTCKLIVADDAIIRARALAGTNVRIAKIMKKYEFSLVRESDLRHVLPGQPPKCLHARFRSNVHTFGERNFR